MTSEVIRRFGHDDAPQQMSYYDPQTGQSYMVYNQESQTHAYSYEQQQPGPYGYPAHPHPFYDWWGSSWRMGNCWMWFWGLVAFALLVVGGIGFGIALSNMSRISTLESTVTSLLSTVDSQGQALATLTTPFAHTADGALVTTNVRQTLDCGLGTPCLMTLPGDLSPYVGLPEICVISNRAEAHTVTISLPAYFQPGDKSVATFNGVSVGESFCFQAISATAAAVTSVNGVVL